jgi:GNAT superfamily N-acetyltransferase
MAGFRVREAERGDADGILRLFEAVAEERQHILSEPPIDRARRRQQFLETIESEDARVFVADADGEVVGDLAAFRPQSTGPATIGMAVAAAWRGRGVGTALMTSCVEWARAAECTS